MKRTTRIDPRQIGLSPRTVIEKLSGTRYALVMDRKSRIIMADGCKINDRAQVIKKELPGVSVSLKTSAPVCRKTKKFLKENGIDIIPMV